MVAADRAWLLQRIAVGALCAYLCVPLVLFVHSPELRTRAAQTGVLLAGLATTTVWMARRNRTVSGAALLLAGLLALVAANAWAAGGVRSPGIQAIFLLVVLGGVLLGWRGAIALAVSIMGVSGGLAIAEIQGRLPVGSEYDVIDRLMLIALYAAVALLVVLAAELSQRRVLEARQAESEARASALRQLETILEVSQTGRWQHDLRTRRYRPDAVLIALTGLEPDADGTLPIEQWSAHVHPVDLPAVRETVQPLFLGAIDQVRVSYRYRHPSRGLMYFDVSLLLERNRKGEPTSVTGLLLDLTPKQTVIRDLGERLKEMRLLYDAAQTLRGDIIDLESTLTALIARIPLAWQFPELAEARLQLGALDVCTAGWTGDGPRLEETIITPARSGRLSVEYRRSPDHDADAIFLREEVDLLHAVTSLVAAAATTEEERRRYRQIEERMHQAQRLESVGTFASGIAHDFNNVLAAVIGIADAARQTPGSDPALLSSDLEQIIAAGRRGQALVQRIRRLGQRQPVTRQAVDLAALVSEVVSLVRPSAPQGVRLEVEFQPDVPPAWADGSQLHQVVMNLLSNAFHATRHADQGVVCVRVRSEARAEGEDHEVGDCVLVVSDSGVGMTSDVAARIFEPFFTTKGEEGTGLGLSVVHGIVRDHDGTIDVQTSPGEGTTFVVRLPSNAAAHPPEETASSPERPSVSRVTTYPLLLVDDDEVLLASTRRLLEQAGFTCIASTEPREILERFAAEPAAYGMLITDMNMPEINGLELIRRARALRPTLPALICSGVDLQSVDSMLEQERIQWIVKPPEASELVGAIGRGLRD